MHRGSRLTFIILTGALAAACGGDSSGPGAGFECLGQALPTTAPAIINFTGRVLQNFLSQSALSGAAVFAFKTGDTNPLAADTTETLGSYSFSFATGGAPVDGYIRATHSSHMTTYAYPAQPIARDTSQTVFMPTPTEFNFLAQAAGVTPVAGDGFIGVVVRNCAGTPVAGATVSSTPAGTVRYNAGGAPSSSATITADDGVAYIANVAAGNVTVQATASGRALRQHVIDARADVITLTEVRP